MTRSRLQEVLESLRQLQADGNVPPLSVLMARGILPAEHLKSCLFCNRCSKPCDAPDWMPGWLVVCSVCHRNEGGPEGQAFVIGEPRNEGPIVPAFPESARMEAGPEKLFRCPTCGARVRLENWRDGTCVGCAAAAAGQSLTVIQMPRRKKGSKARIGILAVSGGLAAAVPVVLDRIAREAVEQEFEAAGDATSVLEMKVMYYERAGAMEKPAAAKARLAEELQRRQVADLEVKRRKERQEQRLAETRTQIESAFQGSGGDVRVRETLGGLVPALQLAVEEDPALTEAWVYLVRIHERLGKKDEALRLLSEAESKGASPAALRAERLRLMVSQYARKILPPALAYGRETWFPEPEEAEEGAALRSELEGRWRALQGEELPPYVENVRPLVEGVLLAVQGDLPGSRKRLTETIERMPWDPVSLHLRAPGLFRIGSWWEAEKDWTAALKLPMPEPHLFLWRGVARLLQENRVRAMEDFTKCLDIEPELFAAAANRAVARLDQGDWKGAREDADRALSLRPDELRPRIVRAVALLRMGEPKAQVLGTFPETVQGRVARGLVYHAAGHPKKAIVEFGRAVAADPDNTEALFGRALTARALGEYALATDDLTRIIEREPTPEACLVRGVARASRGEHLSAMRDLSRAIERKPGAAEAYRARGDSRLATGDLQGAVTDLTEAISLRPAYAEAFHSRGRARARLGDYDGAMDDLNRTLDLQPRSVEAWCDRALVRHNGGDAVAAIGDLTRALDLQATYAPAHFQMACIYSLLAVGKTGPRDPPRRVDRSEKTHYLALSFRHLNKAVDLDLPGLPDAMEDPRLATLRDDPRWNDVMAKAKSKRTP